MGSSITSQLHTILGDVRPHKEVRQATGLHEFAISIFNEVGLNGNASVCRITHTPVRNKTVIKTVIHV